MAQPTESQSLSPVAPGDVLAGKYQVERIIGAGGMGVVVAAKHMALEEKVAIKLLLPHAVGTPEAVARFLREARAAIRIKSEYVARVIDVGTLDSGTPYMIMEYLEGSDLGAWVRSKGPLDPATAVELVLQACEAVAEAHALGIVHRDLKPANLFVVRRADGLLATRVLDFGISKMRAGPGIDHSMTAASTILGSPAYMPPEQMASAKDVDVRADIWSLGVTLYELLAGQPPFQADSLPALCAKILREPPPAMDSLRAGIPPGLQAVIFRCLEKDRNARYQNIAEFADALAPFGPERARTSSERIARTVAMAASAPAGAAIDDRTATLDASWLGPSAVDSARAASSGGGEKIDSQSRPASAGRGIGRGATGGGADAWARTEIPTRPRRYLAIVAAVAVGLLLIALVSAVVVLRNLEPSRHRAVATGVAGSPALAASSMPALEPTNVPAAKEAPSPSAGEPPEPMPLEIRVPSEPVRRSDSTDRAHAVRPATSADATPRPVPRSAPKRGGLGKLIDERR
jgi:serine/threonine-protein kinase